MEVSNFDDALTGEQKIRNFNINFGPQHPAAHVYTQPTSAPVVCTKTYRITC